MFKIAAAAAMSLAALISPTGHQSTHYRHGACQWNNDHATVLCLHRAPKAACREEFGTPVCWWFTGSDTQVLVTWAGRVATS